MRLLDGGGATVPRGPGSGRIPERLEFFPTRVVPGAPCRAHQQGQRDDGCCAAEDQRGRYHGRPAVCFVAGSEFRTYAGFVARLNVSRSDAAVGHEETGIEAEPAATTQGWLSRSAMIFVTRSRTSRAIAESVALAVASISLASLDNSARSCCIWIKSCSRYL